MTFRTRSSFDARAGAVVAGIALTCAALACSELTNQDSLGDHTPPTISLTKASSSNDTSIDFTAAVRDNLGIKEVHIEATGGVVATMDTTFTTAETQSTLSYTLSVPRSVPAGTLVTILGTAFDGAGNRSLTDTLRLGVGNLPPGTVTITSPASGTAVVQGKSVIISTSAKSPLKVAGIGYQTSGSFTASDSTMFTSPLRDSTTTIDTIAIPASAPTGSLVVTPFVRDSLGQRTLGTPITLTVQAPSASTAPPTVNFGTTPRVEVTDTLHVEASDPNGITYLGYEVRLSPTNGSTTPPAASVKDSAVFNGSLISALKTFAMALPSSIFSSFPRTIYVRAFARDARNPSIRGYALLANGSIREDTLVVVAGVTRALPLGGTVADALYHPGRDQLYLTNIARNTLEVFNLADSSFKASIDVGSQPWGIAAWPRDRLGTMGDTVLVANSGGNDISYVDLTTMHEVSGIQEQAFSDAPTPRRYTLPNIIVATATTATSSAGSQFRQFTEYHFSTRPQYLGATCQSGIGNACGNVILAYSTTPTPGQSTPFNENNGTIRWENLTQKTIDSKKSHFFFEEAVGQQAGRADSLLITRYDNILPASDPSYGQVLVPFQQPVVNPSTDPTPRTYTVVVDVNKMGFRDTTYVRNSGNFQRAVFGEGGAILNSRTMTYDATYGFDPNDPDFGPNSGYTLTTPVTDRGISGTFDVLSNIANTAQRISGVAMNFDGSLAAIRGDSTYIINTNLALQGILPTSPSNSGLDFHPRNAQFSGPASSGLIFTASADANLEVWETCHYQRVATVPIRDPIIGPIKAALRPSGQLILFGVTAKGVVIVTLPNNFTAACP